MMQSQLLKPGLIGGFGFAGLVEVWFWLARNLVRLLE